MATASARPADFAAVQAQALALVTANPSPQVFPSIAARAEWYRAKLTCNAAWALRALVVIFARQTAAEQATGATKEDNGVGFGAFDADILTSFARQVERWNADTSKRYASPLSPKQMTLLHKRIRKYAAQLIEHLEGEGKALPVLVVRKPSATVRRAAKARTVDHPDLRTSPDDIVAPHPDTAPTWKDRGGRVHPLRVLREVTARNIRNGAPIVVEQPPATGAGFAF